MYCSRPYPGGHTRPQSGIRILSLQVVKCKLVSSFWIFQLCCQSNSTHQLRILVTPKQKWNWGDMCLPLMYLTQIFGCMLTYVDGIKEDAERSETAQMLLNWSYEVSNAIQTNKSYCFGGTDGVPACGVMTNALFQYHTWFLTMENTAFACS